MTVILDQYPPLQTGTFEIRQMVTVPISAEEARRKVARWLRMEVSHMMGADMPPWWSVNARSGEYRPISAHRVW